MEAVPLAMLHACERYIELLDDACTNSGNSAQLVVPVSRDERALNATETKTRLLSAKMPQRRESGFEEQYVGLLLFCLGRMGWCICKRVCGRLWAGVMAPVSRDKRPLSASRT